MLYDVLQNINTHINIIYIYIHIYCILFFRMIGTLYGLSKRYQVSRIIAYTKSALITKFVPNFELFGAISRNDV